MKKIIFTFILPLFFIVSTYAQEKHKVDLDELNRYYEQMVKEWDIPSVSIGIAKDGELIFTGHYGQKDITKSARPDQHTLYAIASNSKAFTSAIIGMLVQEGKLDWDDKVRDHLPYFAMYDPWVSDNLNIRDMLSHRVGLGTFSGDNLWYKTELTSEEIIKRIQYVPKAYEFRAGYGYSNLMYITAGELIKQITGKTWAENVKERILRPLNMDRTISSINALDTKGNYATPHARKDGENYVIPWVNWDEVASTGGLISSVSDMSKWMIFNLNHGIIGEDTLLSKETRNMLWRPHTNHYVDHTESNDFNRHFNAYGLGWGLSDYHGSLRVGHTGGYDGMITAVTMIPDEDLGIVVLTNGVKSPIMAATYYALDMFLGVDKIDWSSRYLKRTNQRNANDKRIQERFQKRQLNTLPSISIADIQGTYLSKLIGDIEIKEKDGELKLIFEKAPLLSASLTHWHHDVWQIHWDHKQAWFSFGTIKINYDNNLNVTGFDFDVPNDDFYFEELKPYKVD